MEIIRTEKVSRIFIKGNEKINAVREVDFCLEKNDFVYITGRSGSGKSTFLGIAGLLDKPTSGKLFFEGADTSLLDNQQLTLLRRNKIGFIFQQLYLQKHLTAAENAALPLKYAGVSNKTRTQEAAELLKKLGLGNRSHFYPTELSGGEQQRVAVARSLINSPDVIFADEPTSELDSETSEMTMNLLKDLVKERGISALIVTHDELTFKYADKIYRIHDGLLKEKEKN